MVLQNQEEFNAWNLKNIINMLFTVHAHSKWFPFLAPWYAREYYRGNL
jgi:hypothetical protein